jgi:NAD(P)-dependent dehydrogenase (short-subunit alcohol dehydrogenase family)
MGLVEGKVGLVTGAGSGIGRASSLKFAAEGSKVAVVDVNESSGAETVQMITNAGGEAFFVKCDVADEEQVKAMVAAVVAKYGRLDWAHNNAGFGPPEAPVAEQQKEVWEHVMAVDLIGVMLCMKHEIPEMLKAGGGAIVNTASDAGLAGVPYLSAYSAAKWGVNGLTKCAAIEYAAQGIRVNSICPGMTETPAVEGWKAGAPESFQRVVMGIPMQRAGRPKEQAAAACWLCSDDASYVTGVNLPVDGAFISM